MTSAKARRPATRSVAGPAAAVWRARWLILAAVIAAGLGGYLVTERQPAEYTAASRIVFSTTEAFDPLGGNSYDNSARFLGNQVSIITTRPVLQAASQRLGSGVSVEVLATSVDVTVAPDADVLVIAATASSPTAAADRAGSVVEAFRQSARQRVTDRTAAAVAATTDPAVVAQIQTEAAVYGDGIAIVEPAIPPTAPSAPRPLRNAMVLALVAALAGVGVALLRRPRGTDAAPLAEAAGAPALGIVPVRRGRRGGGRAIEPEEHALVLVALDYVAPKGTGPVLVTGVSGSGATASVVFGLAHAAAAQGRTVLVVDAEPASRRLVDWVGCMSPDRSLESLIDPSASLAGVVIPISSARAASGRVVLATLGDRRDVGLGDDEAVRCAVARATDAVDLVLIHTGPVRSSPTALALLGHAAAVVVVSWADEDPDGLYATRYRVEASGQSIAGLIIARPATTRSRLGQRMPASGATSAARTAVGVPADRTSAGRESAVEAETSDREGAR